MTLTPAKAAEVDEFFAQWDDHDNLEEVLTLFKNSGTTIRKFFTRTKAVLNKTSDNAMERLIADLGNTLYLGIDSARIDEGLIEDIANYYLLQLKPIDEPAEPEQAVPVEWQLKMEQLENDLRRQMEMQLQTVQEH